MLEINTKQNGEYENKSIKLNDLGMNQSIEFTPQFARTGEGKFGTYYIIEGTYHKSTGDVEKVSIFCGQGYYPKIEAELNNRITITKIKTEGAKFHTYEVMGGNSPSSSPIKLGKPFEAKIDELKDAEGVYPDKDAVNLLKQQGHFDNESQFIATWKKYGSTEERAKEVFANRGSF